jgi:hypothetical protein
MNDPTRRWRFVLGWACLLAAAVVGIVGYLKLSDEPSLNHQLPYLASTLFALIVITGAGVALLIMDQLRNDDMRVEELSAAVERLSAALGPGIERPARRDPAPPAESAPPGS